MSAVLFCADPLRPRVVDPHFAPQAAAVRELGGTVAVVDHDALAAGDAAAAVRRVPDGLGAAWYRGWMVDVAGYAALAAALAGRGARLHSTPAAYAAAHELPGWYAAFAAHTPASVWRPGTGTGGLTAFVAPLGGGPAVVKDYVKSAKEEWDTACYVPDLDDAERLAAVVARFVELRGEWLTGGLVVRRFERYAGRDGRADEARVWWLDGEPVLVGPHPDTPHAHVEPELTGIAAAVAALGCRFVTTDVARRDDGRWRVVEVGDGQVSDLPAGVDPHRLYAALLG